MEFVEEATGKSAARKRPLVVRVKRKRSQESVETICVEERPAGKKRSVKGVTEAMGQLSYDRTGARVLLKKIETIGCGASLEDSSTVSDLDSSTFNALKRSRVEPSSKKNEDMGEALPKRDRPCYNYMVTKSKKYYMHEENESDSMIFVDMAQVSAWDSDNNHRKTSLAAKKPGKRILDPLTRLLDNSINTALATNDFSEMFALVDQGADVNFQRSDSDGYTCMMAAAKKSNLTVVSKLLNKNADVLLRNLENQTAVDIAEYAKLDMANHNASKILIMLRQAASEQLQKIGVEEDASGDNNSDYVYDIYACHPSSLPNAGDVEAKSIDNNIPSVQVAGLSLDDMGNAEIEFHYDSDWSDLADDEEDSNDENYFGNDYPEDESVEGVENKYDDIYNDSVDSDDDERLPRFDRRGVGRQLKPFVVDEYQSSFAKTSEEIEQLWSLEEKGDKGIDMQHRLEHMEKRTGMHVGAQPREFHVNGLPKFGMELSDDDGDMNYAHYDMDGEEYNNEAYYSDQSY